MATTINAANISIGMDISKLKEGMGASRSEISQLRSILKDSIDPVDKLKSQMVLLERAFKAGAIDADQFARSMDHLKRKVSEVNAAASGGGLQGLFKGQFSQLAGMAAGAFTISSVVGTAQEFDAIIDKSQQLGVSYRDLMVIGRTLEESGGISFDQAGQAISKMQVNLANARDKGGELDAQLKKMGLSTAELANMDAVAAFQKISGAFGQITNQADRMQFATQLFGKAGIDMVPALEIGAQKYAEMQTHLEESGVLNQELAAKMGEAADAGGRLLDHMKGVGMFLVGEALPLMQGFLKLIEDSGKGWKNLRDSVQGVVMQGDAIDQALGITYDSEMLEKMTKAEYDAWVESNARRRAAYIQEQKAAEERRKIEQEINDKQQEVLSRMDAIIEQRRKERAEELAAIEKGRDSTLSALRAKSEGNKKAIVDEADVKRAVEEQIQLEQRKLAMDLASIYATRDKNSKEAQELAAKAQEESADRVRELQDEGVKASQAISDQNRMKGVEKDMSSLEAERQRLLGAGDKNVAATIAPAIKAGTVEAYKAVNQQNEERVARQEQAKRLDEIKQELQKLNAEKSVLLTRIR